ncbi:DUF2850 domain-containing protein [Vibrio sp. B4-12]|nr:DUF2850 domain-containing protein [Vibrio sp. A14(2019)]NNN74649.1 DUF2850 domain-containing protein [Vibrio sp. B7]NNN91644.1 DUF2850 domain-containing protein [Vibrio sp. B8-1]NNO06740.1 DUF2850 domain-containing protein [Vibrio sp. B4-12]
MGMAVKGFTHANKASSGHHMKKKWVLKSLFWIVLFTIAAGFATLLLVSYQEYTSPKNVYGSWIEIGTPSYSTEVLTLNSNGVFRNNRLVSTQFEYDGDKIVINTGSGVTIYQLAGTTNSPQLKRIEPVMPLQRFIKQGYESTVENDENGDPSKNRRSALSEHFSQP